MDWASVGGVLVALAGIVIGQGLEGGKLSALFQPAAFCSSFNPLNMTSEPPPIGTALRTLRGTKATS